MKPLVLIFLLVLCQVGSAQIKTFLLEGQVVDQHNKPVSDVYIVNLSNFEKDISSSNGVFSFWVAPTDTLIFSHISFHRKMVPAYTLMINPIVKLESENVDIPEVRVSPEQKSDIDQARENLKFIQDYQPQLKVRMQQEEANPVNTIMTENNELMRAEASSIRIVQFSPSENIGKLFTKLQKRDRANEYSSTKKQMKEVEKN
ncbi:hypothetical protein [uncultured Draconibacterium sp.]|uniref:hypothetical protein n=1 Tax=uncultured Draconibacterium sp. TaxID=1573823 RepID=UPI003216EC9E